MQNEKVVSVLEKAGSVISRLIYAHAKGEDISEIVNEFVVVEDDIDEVLMLVS